MYSLALLLVFLAQVAEPESAAAPPALESVTVPGTGVELMPPPGFELSPDFNGFIYDEAGASIVVTEVPGSYGNVVESFAEGSPMLEGLEELEREPATLGELPALLIKVKQQGQHVPFLKWLFITGTDEESLVITAAFPEEFADRMDDAMRKALLSAVWGPNAETDPFEGLPYTIETGALLQVAARTGNAIILTPEGNLPGDGTTDVVLSILDQKTRFNIKERTKFAKDRFDGAFEGGMPPITREETISAGGMEGVLLTAEGLNEVTGAETIFFQAILFREQRFFVFEGSAAKELAAAYIPAFEEIVQSFRLKPEQP